MRHGKARFKYADGRLFDGQYINDERCKTGICRWYDGVEYDGQWQMPRHMIETFMSCEPQSAGKNTSLRPIDRPKTSSLEREVREAGMEKLCNI